MSDSDGAQMAKTSAIVRNCYLLLAANSIWLLIPLIGLLTGNNLNVILFVLLAAGLVLFVSNNYIGMKWYYYSDGAKGTIYESHLANIDNIGFIVFFVTLISGLAFLIAAVFILNIFKSTSGYFMFLALDIAMSALLLALAIWVVKHAGGGLKRAAQLQDYKYEKILNIF